MNLARGKIFGLTPCIPIFFKTGLSFLPNRLKATLDCQTSITRQPPGIGPAMCASTPLTGQSASLFLRPFKIILTLFSYLARDVAPGNSKRTPMGMGYLHVSANQRETPTLSAPVDVNQRMSRFGSKADILRCSGDVRSTPMCGRLRVGKDFLERMQHWSVQPCVRPVCAVHMTAGHNALRGSGPDQ